MTKALIKRDQFGLYRRRDNLPARRAHRHLPEYLEKAEVDGLLRAAHSPQAALLMLIQWRAGLRISEALNLEPADLTLDAIHPTLTVRQGKGHRPRIVPVHAELCAAFRTALAYGGRRPGSIINVNRKTAWRWVKRAQRVATQAGLIQPGKRLGTHTLRHSAARHWLANGIPINFVSRWLGHASLQTTLIYLELVPDPLGDIDRVP